MVIPEIRHQVRGIREVAAIAESHRLLIKRLKHICFLLVFLNTQYWALNTTQAKNMGTHGVIYAIEEVDPIQVIQKKLKVMADSGELERRNLEMQKKARVSVERPKFVEGVTKTTKGRVFYYDPTYVVKVDLKDHQGRIFAKKGSKINPLETVSLSTNLLFLDGDDHNQLAWVQEKFSKSIKTNSVRLIIVKGAPLKLAEDLGIPVYFDQGGILTKKLGIKHVPAVVTQENLRLRIEEIKLLPSREPKVEGEQ